MRLDRTYSPKPAHLVGRFGITDEVLIDVLAQRCRLALMVGESKDKNHERKIVRGREQARLDQAADYAKSVGIDPNYARAMVFHAISESCKMQTEQTDEQKAVKDYAWQSLPFAEWRKHLKESLLQLTAVVSENYEDMYGAKAPVATRMYLKFEESKINHEIDDLASHAGRTNLALDLGCATGRLSRKLAKRFRHVIGCDICPSMLEVGRRIPADEGSGTIEYMQADIEEGLPRSIQSDSVNLVVMSLGTASEVANLRRVLASVHRVLAPNGRFVFSFYNKSALVNHIFVPWPLSLRAKLEGNKRYLEVTYDGKVYPVFGEPLDTGAVVKLLSDAGFRLSSDLMTYPTIGAILPNSVLGQKVITVTEEKEGEEPIKTRYIVGQDNPAEGDPVLLEHITAIDKKLCFGKDGAYILATGSKKVS